MMRRLVFLAALAVSTSVSAIESFAPGSENDPRMRATDFLAGTHRYFSAASELLQLKNEIPARNEPLEFLSRLADYALSFGMEERAEVIYRELEAANADPMSLARAQVRLGEFLYQRGYEDRAVSNLRAVRNKIPDAVLPEWQDTMSHALLAQGRYGEAAEVLSDFESPTRSGGPYALYNLGVALINDGRAGQGVNLLDRVGNISAENEEQLSLRDKANLALAYHYLRLQQGGTAIPLFSRVRNSGPLSNRALLGLGWAFLAPRGTLQKKVEVGDEVPSEPNAFKSFSAIGGILPPGFRETDIYKRAGLRPLRLDKVSVDQEAALKRALVPWVELVGRDPIDPAVQEGLLAIPYTLDRLGAHAEARQYYERGIAALEAGRKDIGRTAEYVRSGRMIATIARRTADAESGWTWELKDLPGTQETYYLQALISENRFQEQVKNFRDVELMRNNLEAWSTHIEELQAAFIKRERQHAAGVVADTRNGGQPAVAPAAEDTWEELVALKARILTLRPQLRIASDAQRKLLENLARDELAKQRRRAEKYLVEARFALARIYDRELKGGAP